MFSDSIYGGKEAARRAARRFKRTAMGKLARRRTAGTKAARRRRPVKRRRR